MTLSLSTQRTALRVAVAGAGPAGLVAAIAAKRLGFDVVAFEQAPDFSRVGSAVGMQANGRQVLAALGLHDAFEDRMAVQRWGALHMPPGRVVSRVDMMEAGMPYAGFAVVLRHALQQLLLEAARADGVDLRFGVRCIGARHRDGGATLAFDGGASFDADIVIGCDGIHSAVRESLSVRARKSVVGEAYLRCVSRASVRDPINIGEMWADDGRRLGMFPLASGQTYLFCSVPLGRWNEIREQRLSEWVASWRDFGEDAARVIAGVEDWGDAVYDELKEVRLDRWCEPPFFLAGDAAHAMTPNLGQGANSAMVDALVLMRVLRETLDRGGSLAGAARQYEHVRKAFATRIQTAARVGGRMAAWTSAPARTVRRWVLGLARTRPIRRRAILLTAGYNPREQPYLRAALPLLTSRGT